MLKSIKKWILTIACLILSSAAFADLSVPMYMTSADNTGKLVGTITIKETPYGLLFIPDLHGLTPGIHGFHLHQNPLCTKNGMDAGGHFDPKKTDKHLGPYNNNGHLGDLPALTVTADGSSTLPVLAPRIMHISDIKYHSLMIHEGGDNYSDTPKLGGGGARMICGVIK